MVAAAWDVRPYSYADDYVNFLGSRFVGEFAGFTISSPRWLLMDVGWVAAGVLVAGLALNVGVGPSVADDGDRRGDGAAVLVAHTPAELAAANLDDPERAVPAVIDAVCAALGLSEPPEWTAVMRWTFARPAEPRTDPFGLVDGIGLCGDGWSAPSRIAGAWASGTKLGAELVGAQTRPGTPR